MNGYGYDWRAGITLSVARRIQPEGGSAISAEGPRLADRRADQPATALPIAAAAAGDAAAFARIVAAYQDDMVRVCYVITRDADAADDAVQDAWAIAWRELRKLRDQTRLRQWLVAIAANEARQMMRHTRQIVVTEIRADGPRDDDEDTRVWSGRIDLHNALARLSAQDRELLALRYVAGFDSNELAHVTGLSASGTRARMQRLLATLRRDLEPTDG